MKLNEVTLKQLEEQRHPASYLRKYIDDHMKNNTAVEQAEKALKYIRANYDTGRMTQFPAKSPDFANFLLDKYAPSKEDEEARADFRNFISAAKEILYSGYN